MWGLLSRAMNAKAVVLLLAHAAAAAAAGAVAQAWVHQITVGTEVSGSCTPGAWVDYELVVDEAMADSNLMFEVHDLGTSYNPEALMVAIWEGAVPSDRAAEHRTERASGKVWAVGMNNECFVIGTVTLGVRCSDHVSVNFKVKVVSTVAPVTVMGQAGAIIGEVRLAPRPLLLLGGGWVAGGGGGDHRAERRRALASGRCAPASGCTTTSTPRPSASTAAANTCATAWTRTPARARASC